MYFVACHFLNNFTVYDSFYVHTHSDLLQWSYGVTVWEVFSGGKSPYPGVDPLSLVEILESGRRLNKPTNAACTDETYVCNYSKMYESMW